MRHCVDLAVKAAYAGQYALGAAVVSAEGRLLAAAGSTLAGGHDPTAHPEIVAMRAACDAVANRYLVGATLYTTLEPCPGCTGFAVFARFAEIVYGASQDDALDAARRWPHPVFTWRQIRVRASVVAGGAATGLGPAPGPVVTGRVLLEECQGLLELPARLAAQHGDGSADVPGAGSGGGARP